MKWFFVSNQKTDLKSFFSLRSVFPPSPCFWQGDGYHQGDVRQLRLRSPIWRLKPPFVQFLKITASSPWVCSEGFQALHGAQEMGETYNMMMELLLTAGSSSSSGGSSPDVVVGEIAKDRCYGIMMSPWLSIGLHVPLRKPSMKPVEPIFQHVFVLLLIIQCVCSRGTHKIIRQPSNFGCSPCVLANCSQHMQVLVIPCKKSPCWYDFYILLLFTSWVIMKLWCGKYVNLPMPNTENRPAHHRIDPRHPPGRFVATSRTLGCGQSAGGDDMRWWLMFVCVG